MSRLPTVSGDGNAWGTILNDFLSQAHNADGSIKNLFFNVKDPAYGAKGDGTTDDTAAIQAAINAAGTAGGGTVFFPPGSYLISSSLIVDADSISLIGFGQRTGAPIIMTSAADPSYALIVGNTRNANSCCITGLCFQGLNSTSSTGKGILFRTNGGKILQTKVVYFGGHGIEITAQTGSVYENFLEDVELVVNGTNSSTHGDNLYIHDNVSDSEYHRVIAEGDATKLVTTNGIHITNSGTQKFIDCHSYFNSANGFLNDTGAYCQILGGEWESNTLNGISSGGIHTVIVGAHCFGNANTDINVTSSCSVIGCSCFSSAAYYNVYANSAAGGVIGDNILISSLFSAVYFDTNASGYSFHDNVCGSQAAANVIQGKMTNSGIHGNIVLAAGCILELTGAQGNTIHDNTLIGGGTITRVGTTTRLKNNVGYNPVGQVTAPTFPATTVAVTNTTGVDVTAYIANGAAAITVIQIAGTGGTYVTTGQQIAASSWGNIRIPAGGSVKFTYASGAPTWTWMGD